MKTNFCRAIMFMIFILIISIGTINAQVLTVTGMVIDEIGDALIGVSVSVKGNPSHGTATYIDGRYKIQVEKGQVLVFSFMGYLSQEIEVSKDVHNVEMQVDEEIELQELIIGLAGNASGAFKDKPVPDPEVLAIINYLQQNKRRFKGADTTIDASMLHAETYKIEELSSPEELLPTVTLDDLFGGVDKNFLELSVADELVDLGTQPVITGYLRAYQNHYPVTISPDIAWLLICQGFSRHVNNNSETLRHRFVDFEGQKMLTVERDMSGTEGLAVFPWETIFPEFVQQIAGFTGEELIENLSADFTTTTPTSLIAGQITIMESMKEFFKYKVVMIGCGIPEVTIEGTVEDWEKILNRLDYLSQYELGWWTSELKPVIQKIIDTKKGTFDKDFWMNMIKYHEMGLYGSYDGVDGWLLKFYPYKRDGERSDFKEIKGTWDLPSEIANVPFEFEVQDEARNVVATYNMEFWAGFMGITQNKNTFSVKPEIGWAVNIPSNGSVKK